MIDWDKALHAPVMAVFGQAVVYTCADGTVVNLADAVFDEAFVPTDGLVDPTALGRSPVLGVRLAAFPAGYDPENAQGDTFTIAASGVIYVVKAGKPDGHGWAKLEANIAP